jgi:hypothetical protein
MCVHVCAVCCVCMCVHVCDALRLTVLPGCECAATGRLIVPVSVLRRYGVKLDGTHPVLAVFNPTTYANATGGLTANSGDIITDSSSMIIPPYNSAGMGPIILGAFRTRVRVRMPAIAVARTLVLGFDSACGPPHAVCVVLVVITAIGVVALIVVSIAIADRSGARTIRPRWLELQRAQTTAGRVARQAPCKYAAGGVRVSSRVYRHVCRCVCMRVYVYACVWVGVCVCACVFFCYCHAS